MILVSFEYPPLDGGIARLCGALSEQVHGAGLPIEVVTQHGPDLDVHVPNVPATRVESHRPHRELQMLRGLAMRRGQTMVSGIWYPEGLLAASVRPRRHIVLAHGLELMPAPQPWRRVARRELQRRVLEDADLVVANSRYTEVLVSRVAPRARVAAVPLAVDHVIFSPGDRATARSRWGFGDQRVLLTVSRLAGYKAHDTVLRALAIVPPEERRQLLYAIAGRGAHEPTLRALARQLGVDDQVRWLGFVADASLPSLYQGSDLFVLPTRESSERAEVEGFGLAFLEAQACGLPVLGSRTGGIPDAISDGDGGWLVEQDDVDAIARHLRALVREPDTFARQGAAARARVEREFTWPHYWQRFAAAVTAAGIELR